MKELALTILLIIAYSTVNASQPEYIQSLHAIEIENNQEACVEAAEKAMILVGVAHKQIVSIENTISGSYRGIIYSVVCRADKGLAFSSIAHPVNKTKLALVFDRKLIELLGKGNRYNQQRKTDSGAAAPPPVR